MKSVQLNDDEIKAVICNHAEYIASGSEDISDRIDRLRYLTKRLNDKAPVSDAEEKKGF